MGFEPTNGSFADYNVKPLHHTHRRDNYTALRLRVQLVYHTDRLLSTLFEKYFPRIIASASSSVLTSSPLSLHS